MFTRNPVSTDESDMVGGYQSICPALSARQNGCGNGDDWTKRKHAAVYRTRREAARFDVKSFLKFIIGHYLLSKNYSLFCQISLTVLVNFPLIVFIGTWRILSRYIKFVSNFFCPDFFWLRDWFSVSSLKGS